MWVIKAPLKVLTSRKKSFTLNLNQYRNAHHHLLDDAKKDFAEIMKPRLKGLPSLAHIRISYILCPRTAQLCDVSNICSVVDKFFSDCLTNEGKIPDDNYNHVIMVAYGFGGIDKHDPRVDIVIESVA